MVEYKDLLKKGYSKEEAQRTINIINAAKTKKPSNIRFLDSILYWIKKKPSKDFIEWMNLGKRNEAAVDYFSKRVQGLIRIFFNGIVLS